MTGTNIYINPKFISRNGRIFDVLTNSYKVDFGAFRKINC